MKNNELHQSEELAKHFANYRDEAPLLSTPQIEKLLAERDMLPNQNPPPTPSLKSRGSNQSIVRRIIMTLSGITGLAAVAYLAFFSNLSNQSKWDNKSQVTYP